MYGEFRAALLCFGLAGLFLCAFPPAPQLALGSNAPAFTAQASLGGKTFPFDLRAALRRGPVVLYFFPAAFTAGCTLEAHEFADGMPRFRALHATVIGVSGDDIELLRSFSLSACRSKFAVAADPDLRIARSYDAVFTAGPIQTANRISYVIAPDGQIVYSYISLDPRMHVVNALGALEDLERQRHT